MKTIKKVSVIGGDTRNIYAAKRLEENGYDVSLFGFENYAGTALPPAAGSLADAMAAEIVLLPLPCSKNEKTLNAPFAEREIPLKDIVSLAGANKLILTGMCGPVLRRELEAKGATVADIYENEELTVKNALLTSEGVLGIVLEKLPVAVWGLKAAVTGYGRVAYFVCRALKALGADVTVYARNASQLAKAETAGYRPERIERFAEQSDRFDVVINTVPARVIDENAVMNAKRSCLFIETASAPYGIDFAACRTHGRELVKAFSLPGKTAPKTAGIIIADTSCRVIEGAE